MEITACPMWQHADLQFDLYFGRTPGGKLPALTAVCPRLFEDLEALLVARSSFDCGIGTANILVIVAWRLE